MPDLSRIDPELLAELSRHGFSPQLLEEWAGRLRLGAEENWVTGELKPPAAEDVTPLPARDSDQGVRLAELGMGALSRGELAMVVLAGGMATRMGGVVKALVEALPGRTFLDLRLVEHEHWQRRAAAPLPLWLMTSHATDAAIRAELGSGDRQVAVFVQHASPRLTPQGEIFLDGEGRPSLHATGHGDLPDALRESGLLTRFRAGGGRYLWIANLDNLGAGVDPLVLGWHIAHDRPVTVEVVDRQPGDRGGGPAWLDGRLVILESFRVPPQFDQDAVPVFNTNTFLVDAGALAGLDMEWTYFRVDKQVAGRPAVQFERLIGELTSGLEARYLLVPRSGPESRFLPVKDVAELEQRRAQIADRVRPLIDTGG